MFRLDFRWIFALGCLTFPAHSEAAADRGDQLLVEAVLLAAFEEIEVPAREAGALVEWLVTDGATVTSDQLLTRIDDTEARLALQRVEIELDNARRKAENDIAVRVAEAAAEVAAAELRRALESRKQYPVSVSDAEVDHLRLAAEHAKLQIEQARYDLQTAQLALRVHENAQRQAERTVERHRIASPTSGRLVQILRRRGEWVEPGQGVARILGLDRLRAVGHLNVRDAGTELTGREVRLRVVLTDGEAPVEFPGKVTFVHSEINPVTEQLDFWAEIENPDLVLRPGQKASLVILSH
jgi:multidrug efflux pump subunit AcrA (membrane-fusion protein)